MAAKVTIKDMKQLALKKISKGYSGKAIVAWIDLLGFTQKIISEWDSTTKNPLLEIMKIKAGVLLARKKAVYHYFYEYDNTTLITKVKYPDIITISDSFIFVAPLKGVENSLDICASIISVVGSIIELWKFSIDMKFTLRGGVDIGDIFYSDSDIIGPTFINAYNLEAKKAQVSRVILSHKIKEVIHKHIQTLPQVFQDYFLFWLERDFDGFININPLVMNRIPNMKEHIKTAIKLQAMQNAVNNHNAKNKYCDLISKFDIRQQRKGTYAMFT